MDSSKFLVFFSIYFNVFLTLCDRVTQITYYAITNFLNDTAKNTALTFVIILPICYFFIITLYLMTHYEEGIKTSTKVKYFFYFMLSSEVCFSIGVHKTFKSKFSEFTDNVIVTMKILNGLHIMFISIPQLLIVPIQASSIGLFKGIDVASLVFSSFYIFWSVGFYLMCNLKESDYEAELEDLVNN